jgi:cyanophycinase
VSGTLALVGGGEFGSDCTFDADLLAISGGSEVLIVPTGAAYEHPERSVEQAASHFEELGAKARGLMVLSRHDALDEANANEARTARFVYITGGSPMHLRSVLKATPFWEALLHAWREGGVIAGSSAGAMALCDPMVDPRGGAFTLGLGLLEQVAMIPHHDLWSHDRSRRTFELAGSAFPIVAVDEQTAVIRDSEGRWRVAGNGAVQVMLGGQEVGLDRLP